MPVSAIPFVGAVIGAFAFFIIIVGETSVWASMSGALRRDLEEGLGDDL